MFEKRIQYNNTVLFTNIQYHTVCLWTVLYHDTVSSSQTYSIILYVCEQYCIMSEWHLFSECISLSSLNYGRVLQLTSLIGRTTGPMDRPMLDRSAVGQLSLLSSRTKWQRLLADDTLRIWQQIPYYQCTPAQNCIYIFWSVLKVYTIRYFSIAKLFLIALLRNNYLSLKCIGD